MTINCYPLIFRITVVNYYKLKKTPIIELLNIFKISRSSLYNWVKLYNINKLIEKKQYLKGSKYTDEIRNYTSNYVIKKVNFDYRKLIKNINNKFKIKSHKSSIYTILQNNNITRKRINIKTRYSSKKNIKNKIKQLSKEINIIGRNKIISIDESSFDTHINSYYGWNIKGTQLIVNKIKQRIRYSVISAVSNKNVINTKIIKGSINSVMFIDFIKEVVNKIKNDDVLFMDNARIHHAKIFTEYMKTIKNKILYNVPYCSELNPIEMVFSKVKSIVHKKNNNENSKKLQANIKNGFNKITQENLKGYYDKSLTF
jgi:transposase